MLPLAGVKVVELEGLAIAPHAGMLLQKFGARHNREQRRSSSVPARAPENFASPDGGGDDDVVIEVKDLDTGETHKVRLATTSGIVVTGASTGIGRSTIRHGFRSRSGSSGSPSS